MAAKTEIQATKTGLETVALRTFSTEYFVSQKKATDKIHDRILANLTLSLGEIFTGVLAFTGGLNRVDDLKETAVVVVLGGAGLITEGFRRMNNLGPLYKQLEVLESLSEQPALTHKS